MSTYVVIVDQYIEEFKYRDKILWFILYCKTEFTAKKQKTKKKQWKYNLDIKGLNTLVFSPMYMYVYYCVSKG